MPVFQAPFSHTQHGYNVEVPGFHDNRREVPFIMLGEALINSQFPGIHVLHCLQGAPCAPWINSLPVLFGAHGATFKGS